MEKMGLNEIRKVFRDFYVSKGHYPAKSASLIPRNDKSLLIINSGMAPLKPYFSGMETPPSKRMTTCQKCIRTGDIDNVGITSSHGTFFEMLGSFSFGDYFKEKSLRWGWEFITKVLGMPEDKIWVTVFENDEEAFEIWEKIGIPKDRIIRSGRKDNFWEIGLGPCGPCSEIFFDRGPAYGCGKPDCKPGCSCGRYIEFWNHVFTQFSKEEDGSYIKLEHPNIDTGMGLERLACVMQGTDSIFDVDTIKHILDGVTEAAGVKYEDGTAETDVSVRIITDHLRSMVFMTADGIIPSNEGRGYVLRRLIRRAARHGKLLGIKGKFLAPLSEKVIEVSGKAYPELVEKREFIQKTISAEEEKFMSTIDTGTSMMNGYILDLKRDGKTVLEGEKAFRLYDTYGFPLELTEEILREKGYTVDKDGFNENMKKQRETARKGRRSAGEGWHKAGGVSVPETKFVGYSELRTESEILAISAEGQNVQNAKAGQDAVLYMDVTPFYAVSGGQESDKGTVSAENFTANVLSVEKTNGVFAHKVHITAGRISKGDRVLCAVDAYKRNASARNHTATHLLQQALREVLGPQVRQAGSSVNENTLRFDFTNFGPVTPKQLEETERIVNQKILEFLPVRETETSMEEAVKRGAIALFDEKYGDRVRVINCGDWSIELCGGTHVSNTGQIGAFKIISESGIASGVRRIEAVTGGGILKLAVEKEALLNETARALKTDPLNVARKAASITEELREARKEADNYKKREMIREAQDMIKSAKMIGGIRLITKRFDNYTIEDLRDLSDHVRLATKDTVMVFAAARGERVTFLVSITDDLIEKKLHAGKMIKAIAAAAGGGGGGKAAMAQAGAKDPSKIADAFKAAEKQLL